MLGLCLEYCKICKKMFIHRIHEKIHTSKLVKETIKKRQAFRNKWV